jgi:hypothetical protein
MNEWALHSWSYERTALVNSPGVQAVPVDVLRCAQRLRDSCGNELVGVLFFGSRLVNTSPNRHSAADLFVIVDDYRGAYEALAHDGLVRRSARVLAATNRILPPNVLRIAAEDPGSAGCKCFFISASQLQRELGPRSRDHFCKGRLTQTVAIVETRDASTRRWLGDLLEEARSDSVRWVPAYLEASFSAQDYCARMMEMSYRSEIRPESKNRVHEVLAAQGDELVRRYALILRERGPAAGLEIDGQRFRRAATAPPRYRRRDAYFAWSRVRATLRWTKYVVTFENWLDYIVQKLHRRSGVRIELTKAQRRYPFLLLWPKLFSVVWQLQRQPSGQSHAPEGHSDEGNIE